MNTEEKRAGGSVDLAVISPLVFLGLDAEPRIPVGKNLRVLARIDRNRADIQYFRRRRLRKSRRREKNKRDRKTDSLNSLGWNHSHKFTVSSSSLLISEPVYIDPIQNATSPSRFPCLRKSRDRAHFELD